jgi:hypothetical protein
MSPVAFLLLPLVISVVGSAAVVLFQRTRPPTVEASIDHFCRARETLRQRDRGIDPTTQILLPLAVPATNPRPRRPRST